MFNDRNQEKSGEQERMSSEESNPPEDERENRDERNRAGSATNRTACPAIGILEWFHLNDREHVDRTLRQLEEIGISELRTGISWADYHTSEGRKWIEWLVPRLADRYMKSCWLPLPRKSLSCSRSLSTNVETSVSGPGKGFCRSTLRECVRSNSSGTTGRSKRCRRPAVHCQTKLYSFRSSYHLPDNAAIYRLSLQSIERKMNRTRAYHDRPSPHPCLIGWQPVKSYLYQIIPVNQKSLHDSTEPFFHDDTVGWKSQ